MKDVSNPWAIILFLILLAIGGLVMYPDPVKHTPPKIQGPTTPPPQYVPTR